MDVGHEAIIIEFPVEKTGTDPVVPPTPLAIEAPARKQTPPNATICYGHNELFFGYDGEKYDDRMARVRRAQAFCARCDVAARCLERGLEDKEPHQVRGGEEIHYGRIVTGRRQVGRIRKGSR